MATQEILMTMTESGLNLSLAGDSLRVSPRELLTDETRKLIRANKPELIKLLQEIAETGNQVSMQPYSTQATAIPDTKPTDPQESSPGRQPDITPAPVPSAKPVPAKSMPEQQPVTDDQTWDEDAYQERAAIVEHDGGIPREWAEGVARLCTMARPGDIPRERWEAITRAASAFADRWAKEASSLGWTTEEVFGVHRAGPMVRFGSMGLVFLLADPRTTLESLDADKATFLAGDRGARQTFRRDTFNMDQSKLRLVWETQKGD
ncbi:MAG: hypothetical protein HQL79_00015 [Magnetococcales bacterium]|nr:hypothetical protein [Magnetococcales bacterium]